MLTHAFGWKCFPAVSRESPRASTCIFLGYILMLKKDIVVQISPEHLFLAFSKQLKTGASLPLTHSILSAGILTGMQEKSALKMLDLNLARAALNRVKKRKRKVGPSFEFEAVI